MCVDCMDLCADVLLLLYCIMDMCCDIICRLHYSGSQPQKA